MNVASSSRARARAGRTAPWRARRSSGPRASRRRARRAARPRRARAPRRPSTGTNSEAWRLPSVIVPVLSSRSTSTSPEASTARPDIASTLRCTSRSMPAMPIAESSAPIVVGISATSSAIRTVCEIGGAARRARTGCSVTTAARKVIVSPASRMLSAISFGVLRRSAPSTSAIIRSRNDLPGSWVTCDHEPVREEPRAAGDGRAVAARLADDRRRLAGDRRLVDRADALDDLAVGGDHLAGLDDDDVAALQLGRRHVLDRAVVAPAVASRRRARRAQRVRLRLAAALGDRLGEVREQHGQPEPDGDHADEPERAGVPAREVEDEDARS